MPASQRKLQHLVTQHAQQVLQQKYALVLQLKNVGDYTKPMVSFYNGTLGGHVRHAVQHFEKVVLKSPVSPLSSSSVANYDERSRRNDIEVDIQAGLASIEALDEALSTLDSETTLKAPITVAFMGDTSGSTYAMESTVERELSFCAHHAVHHLSMMKLMMQELGYAVDDGVGKANSTVENEEN